MSAPVDPATRKALAKAALEIAAAKPWRAASIHDLAQAAGCSAADFYPASIGDALDCVEESFDLAMAGREAQPNESVRDRLFDILMRRFEAMELVRKAVLAMEEGHDRDPTLMALAHQRHVRAARWALTLAGLDADGMGGAARAQGLGIILGQARAAWRGDDAGDFAKTMASLDKNLRRAEETFGRWAGFEAKPAAPTE